MNKNESDWLEETLRQRCPGGAAPTRLYKFLSSESKYFPLALHELMLHNRIRLSGRKDFNDPLDTHFAVDVPDSPSVIMEFVRGIAVRGGKKIVDPYIENAIRSPRTFRQSVLRSMESSLDKIGIYSLTDNIHHPLMWSHYANSHRGIALIYRHGTRDTFGAFPIRYQEDYPRALLDEGEIPIHLALVKGNAWRYEGEWRIARPNAAHTWFDIPSNLLSGLIFGTSASQETYNFVFDLIKRRAAAALPPILVYRAAIGESFDLEFRQFVGANTWQRVDLPHFASSRSKLA